MNVVILANCFAFEIKRCLQQHNAFNDVYKNVDIISTYLLNGIQDSNRLLLNNADLVINQNPKDEHWASTRNIKKVIKSDAIYLQLEFWRFNGFWPIKSNNERFNPNFWFPVNEHSIDLDFESYMNYPFDEALVKTHFNNCFDKLIEIDKFSDVKMLDFVSDSFHKFRLFSDEWHPYPNFFQELSKKIVKKLGIETSIVSELPPLGINNDRYRLIPNSICEILGLRKDFFTEDFYYLSKKITAEEYYYFSKSISDREVLKSLTSQEKLKSIFYQFLGNN